MRRIHAAAAAFLLAATGLRAGWAQEAPAPPAAQAARPWDLMPVAGGFVEVTPEGALGRRFLDPDFARERQALDRAVQGAPRAPVVWRTWVCIVRSIDAEGPGPGGTRRRYRAAFGEEQVAAFRRVAGAFADMVHAYSGGAARLDATVEVLDGPLARLDGEPDMAHPWVESFASLVGDRLRADAADSYMVFWPAADAVPHRNVWGLTGWPGPFGAGYSWVAWLGGAVDERAYAEVALHEWLHQVEFMRGALHGYPGLPALHDGERMGYAAGGRQPGWMLWYRDFMSTYMTPGMWGKLVPRRAPQPEHRPSFRGEFVAPWLVAGPFDNADDQGLDRDPLGAAAFLPSPGAAAGGRAWEEAAPGDDGVLDFAARLTPKENGVAWAHAYLRSPTRQKAVLWLGSDDGVVVRLNGREVHRRHVHRALSPDQDEVPLDLEEGWNRLLVAVDQGGGGWSLCARLAHPDGRAIEGLVTSARPPEGWTPPPPGLDAPPAPGAWRLSFFDWERVKDDPWALLPDLDEARLRVVTGDSALRVVTGEHFTALVPGPGRALGPAPVVREAKEAPGAAALDNRIDFGRESVAWLRHMRGGIPRDLLLLRPDAVEPWLRRLDALDDPSVAVLGRVTAGRRPLVAVETRLPWRDAEPPPPTELALLRGGDLRVAASLVLDDRVVARGEPVRGRVRLRGLGDGPATVAGLRVASLGAQGGRDLWSDTGPRTVEPGAETTVPCAFPLAEDAPLGPLPLALRATAGDLPWTDDLEVVQVAEPFAVRWLDETTGAQVRALRAGKPRWLRAEVENRLRRDARLTLAVEGVDATGPETVDLRAHGRGEARFRVTVAAPASGAARATATVAVARPQGVAAPAPRSFAWTPSPWAVVGPFPHPEEGGFAMAHPPETAPFDAGSTFAGAAGPVSWCDLVPEGVTATAGAVDFAALFPGVAWAAAYAAADLESPDERRVVLRLGSDDTLVVWVNGERVLSREVWRPAARDQDRVEVALRKGRNRVLVRVGQGAGGWGFFLDITDAEGRPVPEVALRPPGP